MIPKKLARFIATQKLLFMRGWGIVGIPGMAFVISASVQQYLVRYGINLSLWIIYPACFLAIWLAGYLEKTTGIYEQENDFQWRNNPAFIELMEKKNDIPYDRK